MGLLRSQYDWTGRDINGVILGVPAREKEDGTGDYIWEHSGMVEGTIDSEGDIFMEVPNA